MAIKGVLLFWNAEIKGGFSQMKKNNKKGFTLVELVIVVAVMAVLVAVAIPTIGSITGEAKEAVAKSNAKTIESIIKLEEAEASKENDTDLDPAKVAQALYEAKLGITNTSAYATYYYTPSTGAVAIASAEAGDDAWTITFAEEGEVTVADDDDATQDAVYGPEQAESNDGNDG